MSDSNITYVKDYIDTNINTNGNRSITGGKLNTALNMLLDGVEGGDSYEEKQAVYGVQWSFTSGGAATVTRTGDNVWHRVLPVQRRMRGCVMKSNGEINYYLKADDWTKKADGTVSDLTGLDGNVMVEIPTFYYKFTTSDASSLTATNNLWISLSKFDEDCVVFKKQYVGAYKGYVSSNILKSVKGNYSSVNIPLVKANTVGFREMARNNNPGTDNWNAVTYDIRKAIWILFTVEYANLNSQDTFHTSLDNDGFHYGGLSAGISSGYYSGVYAIVKAGLSDDAGNFSSGANRTVTKPDGSTATLPVARYRGIENPFGDVWEWCDGVFHAEDNNEYEILNKKDFELLHEGQYYGDVTTTCRSIGVCSTASNGYVIEQIIGGKYCDLIPKTVGSATPSGSNNWYNDGWWNSSTSFTGVLWGGASNSGARDGLACVNASNAPSISDANIGSRLAYIPDDSECDCEKTTPVNGELDNIEYLMARANYSDGDSHAVYGVQWRFVDTSGHSVVTRIGDMGAHMTLPVQSKMKGCVVSTNGNVNYYLEPTDWSLKAGTNTASVLTGADGNVMIEIPEFYYKHTAVDGIHTLLISLSKFDDDCVKFEKQYVGAYKGSKSVYNGSGYVADNVMRSIKGTYATVNNSLYTFRTAARANGNNGWNVITYNIRKAIWMLFTVEYATLNSQTTFNGALDSFGFHQGGLGDGLSSATWSDGTNTHYISMPTGTTDSFGNSSCGSTNITYYRPTGDNTYIASDVTMSKPANRYRGIENPFGEVWEWTDGIFHAGEGNVYEIVDKAYFTNLTTSFSGNLTVQCRNIGFPAQSNGQLKEIIGGRYCDIIAGVSGGSEGNNIFYGDYYWIAAASFTCVLWGGNSHYGALDGLACVTADAAPSASTARLGSRLAYIP